MKSFTNTNYLIAFIFIVFSTLKLQAQLGFCGGNSGDPIFEETFGTGTVNGPQLPAGTTTYNFTTGAPDDGDYTISIQQPISIGMTLQTIRQTILMVKA